MFFKNVPFGARLALYVSNEVLRRHKLLGGQPELFLEDHKMEEGRLSGREYVLRTTYSAFETRDRIHVLTWIYRDPKRFNSRGTVEARICQGEVLKRTIAETFRVNWDQLSDFFGIGSDYFQPYVEFTTAEGLERSVATK